ncbi:hypothetical protein ACFL35_12340 [Candidatus Riflebacteria bacterium]
MLKRISGKIIIFLFLFNVFVVARTKMTTLPVREDISININNEGYSLVEEERIINLQKGTNRLDFSWKGVSINPDSIFLQILDHPDMVRLISTEYPPGENAIVMQVYSEKPFQEKMRITYLLSGLRSVYSYYSVAENSEKNMNFKGHLRLFNHSGEDFKKARIRVTGQKPVKKDLEAGESKKFLFRQSKKLAIKKVFYWDSKKQPHDPEKTRQTVGIPMYYEIENSEANGLGDYPVPYGKMRIYQKDKKGETAFIGEDWLKYTPINEKFKLYLGDSRDISVRRRKLSSKNTTDRTNSYNNIVLYHKDEKYRYDIKNFKKERTRLTIVDYFDGFWVITNNTHKFEKKDAKTLEFKLDMAPNEKLQLDFEISFKNLRR